jgi:predicted nucleic acid-binding protein
MSGPAPDRAFLDSNVILHLLSADHAKADRAETLLQRRPIISVQVLNEVTSVCRRKLRMPWDEILALMDTLKTFCDVVPVTIETHAEAMQVAQRHRLSFYDAHIVAAAIQSGATTLLSEDMHAGLVIEGLTVRNPFLG